MNNRILCVDDEPALLKLYETQLKQFDVVVAQNGQDALAILKVQGPFAVIVSDLRMPVMNGAQFLARAREVAPTSVRMLMTGETDLTAALDAINEGILFRFLMKPCPGEAFRLAIRAGIEQHRLIMAEKELLEKTLLGSIEVLTEVLSLVSPLAFGKSIRIRRLVQQLATFLEFPDPWILDVAVMLSQIGCVTVPDSILTKIYSNERLTKDERIIFESHPKIGRDLISKIPRLEEVAQIIFFQRWRYADSWVVSESNNSEIPQGAQILNIAIDCEELESTGISRRTSIARLLERQSRYASEVLRALEQVAAEETTYSTELVPVLDLQVEMVLAEDLTSKNGVLLAPKGQTISEALLRRLLNIADKGNVCDQIKVLVPDNVVLASSSVKSTITSSEFPLQIDAVRPHEN